MSLIIPEPDSRARCYIVELYHTGHRVSLYLALNIEAALSKGFDTWVITTIQTRQSAEFSQILANFSPDKSDYFG